jgi:hypothetical protein
MQNPKHFWSQSFRMQDAQPVFRVAFRQRQADIQCLSLAQSVLCWDRIRAESTAVFNVKNEESKKLNNIEFVLRYCDFDPNLHLLPRVCQFHITQTPTHASGWSWPGTFVTCQLFGTYGTPALKWILPFAPLLLCSSLELGCVASILQGKPQPSCYPQPWDDWHFRGTSSWRRATVVTGSLPWGEGGVHIECH